MMDPALAAALSTALGSGVVGSRRLGGGDVAEAYRVELSDGRRVFAKTQRQGPPGCVTTEAAGLRWLAASTVDGGPQVPEVLSCSDGDATTGVPNHLALAWIDERASPPDDAAFGRELAALHRAGASAFGREDRRTTGSRGLPNEPCATWVEFFATQRLLPLARLATDTGALDPATVVALERVAGRLAALGGPPEPPARLHGDLWAGNRLVDASGRSWLIDPAAHGGHREFDLAMMRLFGGYGEAAFHAYSEVHPLADGWRERVSLHQLAPLVVHAVKFGGGYVDATRRALAALR